MTRAIALGYRLCKRCGAYRPLEDFAPSGEYHTKRENIKSCRRCRISYMARNKRVRANYPTRQCGACCAAFKPSYLRQRYCSHSCAAKDKPSPGRHRSGRQVFHRICPVCKQPYETRDRRVETCGLACGQRRRRLDEDIQHGAKLPERTPGDVHCPDCFGVRWFHTDLNGVLLSECRCGVRAVPLKRPADFERYEATDRRMRELAANVVSACSEVNPVLSHPRVKKMHDFRCTQREVA